MGIITFFDPTESRWCVDWCDGHRNGETYDYETICGWRRDLLLKYEKQEKAK